MTMDLLTWPALGPFLKWRHARTAMQIPLLLVAALIIFDGLVGPQLAPKNLATVGAWLHYRGLVVLALLLAGNLFCMACPFMLPRQLARRLRERLGRGLTPPRWLRSKWLAIGLVVAFFFCYEAFSLWATPWWTAWVALGYFAVAFAVYAIFRGATFCKAICPLGQFNFFGSLVSPLEIKVREPGVCEACATKDCITAGQITHRPADKTAAEHPERSTAARSRRSGAVFRARPHPSTRHSSLSVSVGRPAQDAAGFSEQDTSRMQPGARGCELALFQERKVGNMDCTFCLDCIHACPYDNVGLLARTPTAELWADPFRAGIGRFSQRRDLAVLVVVFTFGAFLNAFAMIRPVYALKEGLARWLNTGSRFPGLALLFVLGLVVLPAITLPLAAAASRALSGRQGGQLGANLMRYVYALVPVGFGMWLAHYSFHFLTGGLTIVPVVQSFLADIGLYAGRPQWGLGALVPYGWLFPIEAMLLYLGAFGSIIVAFRIAAATQSGGLRPPQSSGLRYILAAGPWMALILALLSLGLWILVQPMEMRGTMQMVSGG